MLNSADEAYVNAESVGHVMDRVWRISSFLHPVTQLRVRLYAVIFTDLSHETGIIGVKSILHILTISK